MPIRESSKRKLAEFSEIEEEGLGLRKNLKPNIVREGKNVRENAEILNRIKKGKEINPINNELFQMMSDLNHLNFYDDFVSYEDNEPTNMERKKSEIFNQFEKRNEDLYFERDFCDISCDLITPSQYVHFHENEEDKNYQIHTIKTISDYKTEKKDRFTQNEDDMEDFKNSFQESYKSITKAGKQRKMIHVFS